MSMVSDTEKPNRASPEEREAALHDLEVWWELPIRLLGIVWLVLLVYELLIGPNALVSILIYIIWGIFILDFCCKLLLATHRVAFLRNNILTILSLAVPALRLLRALQAIRFLRLAQTLRSMRLVAVVGSLNRGMRAVRIFLGKYHTGFVLVFTTVVTFVGAAGMYAFEHNIPGSQGFETFWDSLWWTAMVMTTIASQWWPVSAEGRFLAFLLSLYAFAVFGFITAVLASLFVGKNREDKKTED